MNDSLVPESISKRLEALAQKREAVLKLEPEAALDRILDDPQPVALVHSLAAEDLYLLIQEVGPEDALPLLQLASNPQWEYLLDLEGWRGDRPEIPAVTKWFSLLLKADAERFIKWVATEKKEFFEYYLSRHIEVRLREHDQDPSDFGESFFSYDNWFYVRFRQPERAFLPEEGEKPPESPENGLIEECLKRISDDDFVTYQNMLLESAAVIPAEAEEENYRLRNVRLAEKGFSPHDEAIGIYQRLAPEDLTRRYTKVVHDGSLERGLAIPRYPLSVMGAQNRFAQALMQIEGGEVLHQLQSEFAALCNRIIAADQKEITGREDLRRIVSKACGYLSIGLEAAAGSKEAYDRGRGAGLIRNRLLVDIFRVGYGQALELKWEAEKWRKQSWAARSGVPLSFYGEAWVGVLGGVLLDRPLFFDNYRSGVLYREFASLTEVKETRTILQALIAFDKLLCALDFTVINFKAYPFLTYKSLLLTLWARAGLGLSEKLGPIFISRFRPFYNRLWEPKTEPRRIKVSVKESLLTWLSEKSGWDAYKISQQAGQTLEDLFSEIESEYCEVAAKDLDPRYVQLFLLQRR